MARALSYRRDYDLAASKQPGIDRACSRPEDGEGHLDPLDSTLAAEVASGAADRHAVGAHADVPNPAARRVARHARPMPGREVSDQRDPVALMLVALAFVRQHDRVGTVRVLDERGRLARHLRGGH